MTPDKKTIFLYLALVEDFFVLFKIAFPKLLFTNKNLWRYIILVNSQCLENTPVLSEWTFHTNVFVSMSTLGQRKDLIYSRPRLSIWLFQLLMESWRNECIHIINKALPIHALFSIFFTLQRNAADYCSAPMSYYSNEAWTNTFS